MDGMKEHDWGRSLAMKTIKSIIARGRTNAMRQRNKELAAAGTPARKGRPGRASPEVSKAEEMLARRRALPQAMPDEEAERRFNKRPKRGDEPVETAQKSNNCG